MTTRPRKPKPRQSKAATEREARLRQDTEILQSLADINASLRSLAASASAEFQHSFERIQNLEQHVAQMHKVLKVVIKTVTGQEGEANWWKNNGGGPDA